MMHSNNNTNISNSSEDGDWEVRPGGMLVQRRDDDAAAGAAAPDNHHQTDAASAAASFGPGIKISVSHGSAHHDLNVTPNSTFGDVKKLLALKTGLEPGEQKILFRGVEKGDTERLQAAGVKDRSKVVLVEDIMSKERQVEQQPVVTEEIAKALAAIAGVRAEIDKLSERVNALEVAVNGGTKIASEEFDMSAELLMRQLLKLDGIEAEGEARVQRKAEVRRVQKFHEILDDLKAKNSNPFEDSSKTVSVTTEWETFDNGVGSLNPPLPSSSSSSSKAVTRDWEKFD